MRKGKWRIFKKKIREETIEAKNLEQWETLEVEELRS